MNNESSSPEPQYTTVIFSNEARKKLFEGVAIAAEAVGTTLGPKGKTVLIQQTDAPSIVTKDGVTVSKSIKLKEPIMRMGAELIREAASQTNEVAGDGTTTSTILTYALIKEGMKLLEGGYQAKELCEGIQKAQKLIDAQLESNAKQIKSWDEISQIGTISANGDTSIGKIIADAMEKVGKDGIITIEDAKGTTTSLTVAEGMQIERGYLSPYFVTNQEKMHAAYTDSAVLITDKKISLLRDIIPALEFAMKQQTPLLIVADDVEGEALQGLVLNRVKSNLSVVAIKSPGYGQHKIDLLNDLCIMTGATLISSNTGTGFDNASKCLGKIKKVIVDNKITTIVSSDKEKEKIEARIAELQNQLQDVTLTVEEIQKLKIRIAKLASGVAIIKVGGSTEVEMIERKYRIEDALNATRAAVEEGIVPGGGIALFRAVNNLKRNQASSSEVSMGMQIVENACIAPIKKITLNAGVSSDIVLQNLRNGPDDFSYGYDAATDTYVNMIEKGIIDPVKVTRTALKNACSVAITFLTLDAVIHNGT